MSAAIRLGSTTFLRFSASFISGAPHSALLAAAVRLAQYTSDHLEPVEGIPEGEPTTVDGRPIAVEEEANADNLREEVRWSKVTAANREVGIKRLDESTSGGPHVATSIVGACATLFSGEMCGVLLRNSSNSK